MGESEIVVLFLSEIYFKTCDTKKQNNCFPLPQCPMFHSSPRLRNFNAKIKLNPSILVILVMNSFQRKKLIIQFGNTVYFIEANVYTQKSMS
jgi:hypothetical protein